MKSFRLKPATPEAMQLLLEGSIALARIEETGVRIDMDYLRTAIRNVTKLITELEEKLRFYDEYRVWVRKFGNSANLESRTQLAQVIFEELKYRRNPMLVDPHSRQYNNRAIAFEHLNLPFLKEYFRIARLKKARSTNLKGLLVRCVRCADGSYRVHPFFDLYTAESYRSGSSDPNFQNNPIRDKEVASIVRSAVIPDPGCDLYEVDYGSQEVRCSYFYHQDPKLRDYILGGGDMHRDRAMELYLLSPEELGDYENKAGSGYLPRYCAKNKFVFPQFYGSIYCQCAPNLWDAIGRMDMKRSDGVGLYEHLKQKGITCLGACDLDAGPQRGTFEHVVYEAQRRMWQEVFVVYNQWKEDWWNKYLVEGGVRFLSGFVMDGVFEKNQVLCDPIQGTAFHCLLWSIIEVDRELRARRLKTRIVHEIHDSMTLNVPRNERDEVLPLVKEICVDRVAKHWPWISIPLAAEFEVCEGNWFNKKKVKV